MHSVALPAAPIAGATIYGRRPELIHARRSRMTYGIRVGSSAACSSCHLAQALTATLSVCDGRPADRMWRARPTGSVGLGVLGLFVGLWGCSFFLLGWAKKTELKPLKIQRKKI
jgi:hypothetical protein